LRNVQHKSVREYFPTRFVLLKTLLRRRRNPSLPVKASPALEAALLLAALVVLAGVVLIVLRVIFHVSGR
jgi:hypothetical protein